MADNVIRPEFIKAAAKKLSLTDNEVEACHLLYPVLRLLAQLHEENAEAAENLDGEVAASYYLTRAQELRIEADRLERIERADGVRVCDEGECRAAERDSIICAGECDVAAGRRPDGVAPTDPVPSLESSVKLPLHQAVQWNGAVQCAEREPHKPVVLDGRTVLAVHAKLAAGVPECVNHQQENGK